MNWSRTWQLVMLLVVPLAVVFGGLGLLAHTIVGTSLSILVGTRWHRRWRRHGRGYVWHGSSPATPHRAARPRNRRPRLRSTEPGGVGFGGRPATAQTTDRQGRSLPTPLPPWSPAVRPRPGACTPTWPPPSPVRKRWSTEPPRRRRAELGGVASILRVLGEVLHSTGEPAFHSAAPSAVPSWKPARPAGKVLHLDLQNRGGWQVSVVVER